MVRILLADPGGIIVLPRGNNAEWAQQVTLRLHEACLREIEASTASSDSTRRSSNTPKSSNNTSDGGKAGDRTISSNPLQRLVVQPGIVAKAKAGTEVEETAKMAAAAAAAAAAVADVMRRIVIVPTMAEREYLTLCALSDVILDPFVRDLCKAAHRTSHIAYRRSGLQTSHSLLCAPS